MTRRPRVALGILVVASLASSAAFGFKMGTGSEYQSAVVKAKSLKVEDRWVYERMKGGLLSFGDPIHEDMTVATVKLLLELDSPMACGATAEARIDLVRPVAEARIGNAVCCGRSADSYWCDSVSPALRYEDFADPLPPLVAGTRWNDDACHMTLRRETTIPWAAWMLDSNYRKSANLNYSSHYHDKQFLHSMASIGFGRPESERESTSETIHKIMTWSEFAFRVAEGSIDASTPLNQVPTLLSPGRKKAFDLAFGAFGPLTVGELFAGTKNYDPRHVRQLSLGALLHTVQDSFSASHVERVGNGTKRLSDRGAIIRFLNYRTQDPSLHAKEDIRPEDATSAKATDFHPVALGARLAACAAAGRLDSSKWESAKLIVESLLERQDPSRNLLSSPGRFARPDVFLTPYGQ